MPDAHLAFLSFSANVSHILLSWPRLMLFQPIEPTVTQKQTEDHFSWYSEPQWICDNRFTCYLHRGLYSQISGISGLTGGDYALYSIHGRSELIMHQYGSKYGSVSWTEVRTGSRCINHLRDFQCCQKWVVFPNGRGIRDCSKFLNSGSLFCYIL